MNAANPLLCVRVVLVYRDFMNSSRSVVNKQFRGKRRKVHYLALSFIYSANLIYYHKSQTKCNNNFSPPLGEAWEAGKSHPAGTSWMPHPVWAPLLHYCRSSAASFLVITKWTCRRESRLSAKLNSVLSPLELLQDRHPSIPWPHTHTHKHTHTHGQSVFPQHGVTFGFAFSSSSCFL